MLNLKKHLIIGAAAAGIALSAIASFAQMPPSGGPGQDGAHAPSAEQIAKFEQRRAKHQAEFHDKLKITAAQETAWKTFLEKTMPVRPATPPAGPGKEEFDQLTTPQLLDRMAEFAKQRETKMAAHIAAVKEFYAVLSPEQQQVFDQEYRKMQKHRFEHGRFGRGHGPQHDAEHGPDQAPNN